MIGGFGGGMGGGVGGGCGQVRWRWWGLRVYLLVRVLRGDGILGWGWGKGGGGEMVYRGEGCMVLLVARWIGLFRNNRFTTDDVCTALFNYGMTEGGPSTRFRRSVPETRRRTADSPDKHETLYSWNLVLAKAVG